MTSRRSRSKRKSIRRSGFETSLDSFEEDDESVVIHERFEKVLNPVTKKRECLLALDKPILSVVTRNCPQKNEMVCSTPMPYQEKRIDLFSDNETLNLSPIEISDQNEPPQTPKPATPQPSTSKNKNAQPLTSQKSNNSVITINSSITDEDIESLKHNRKSKSQAERTTTSNKSVKDVTSEKKRGLDAQEDISINETKGKDKTHQGENTETHIFVQVEKSNHGTKNTSKIARGEKTKTPSKSVRDTTPENDKSNSNTRDKSKTLGDKNTVSSRKSVKGTESEDIGTNLHNLVQAEKSSFNTRGRTKTPLTEKNRSPSKSIRDVTPENDKSVFNTRDKSKIPRSKKTKNTRNDKQTESENIGTNLYNSGKSFRDPVQAEKSNYGTRNTSKPPMGEKTKTPSMSVRDTTPEYDKSNFNTRDRSKTPRGKKTKTPSKSPKNTESENIHINPNSSTQAEQSNFSTRGRSKTPQTGKTKSPSKSVRDITPENDKYNYNTRGRSKTPRGEKTKTPSKYDRDTMPENDKSNFNTRDRSKTPRGNKNKTPSKSTKKTESENIHTNLNSFAQAEQSNFSTRGRSKTPQTGKTKSPSKSVRDDTPENDEYNYNTRGRSKTPRGEKTKTPSKSYRDTTPEIYKSNFNTRDRSKTPKGEKSKTPSKSPKNTELEHFNTNLNSSAEAEKSNFSTRGRSKTPQTGKTKSPSKYVRDITTENDKSNYNRGSSKERETGITNIEKNKTVNKFDWEATLEKSHNKSRGEKRNLKDDKNKTHNSHIENVTDHLENVVNNQISNDIRNRSTRAEQNKTSNISMHNISSKNLKRSTEPPHNSPIIGEKTNSFKGRGRPPRDEINKTPINKTAQILEPNNVSNVTDKEKTQPAVPDFRVIENVEQSIKEYLIIKNISSNTSPVIQNRTLINEKASTSKIQKNIDKSMETSAKKTRVGKRGRPKKATNDISSQREKSVISPSSSEIIIPSKAARKISFSPENSNAVVSSSVRVSVRTPFQNKQNSLFLKDLETGENSEDGLNVSSFEDNLKLVELITENTITDVAQQENPNESDSDEDMDEIPATQDVIPATQEVIPETQEVLETDPIENIDIPDVEESLISKDPDRSQNVKNLVIQLTEDDALKCKNLNITEVRVTSPIPSPRRLDLRKQLLTQTLKKSLLFKETKEMGTSPIKFDKSQNKQEIATSPISQISFVSSTSKVINKSKSLQDTSKSKLKQSIGTSPIKLSNHSKSTSILNQSPQKNSEIVPTNTVNESSEFYVSDSSDSEVGETPLMHYQYNQYSPHSHKSPQNIFDDAGNVTIHEDFSHVENNSMFNRDYHWRIDSGVVSSRKSETLKNKVIDASYDEDVSDDSDTFFNIPDRIKKISLEHVESPRNLIKNYTSKSLKKVYARSISESSEPTKLKRAPKIYNRRRTPALKRTSSVIVEKDPEMPAIEFRSPGELLSKKIADDFLEDVVSDTEDLSHINNTSNKNPKPKRKSTFGPLRSKKKSRNKSSLESKKANNTGSGIVQSHTELDNLSVINKTPPQKTTPESSVVSSKSKKKLPFKSGNKEINRNLLEEFTANDPNPNELRSDSRNTLQVLDDTQGDVNNQSTRSNKDLVAKEIEEPVQLEDNNNQSRTSKSSRKEGIEDNDHLNKRNQSSRSLHDTSPKRKEIETTPKENVAETSKRSFTRKATTSKTDQQNTYSHRSTLLTTNSALKELHIEINRISPILAAPKISDIGTVGTNNTSNKTNASKTTAKKKKSVFGPLRTGKKRRKTTSQSSKISVSTETNPNQTPKSTRENSVKNSQLSINDNDASHQPINEMVAFNISVNENSAKQRKTSASKSVNQKAASNQSIHETNDVTTTTDNTTTQTDINQTDDSVFKKPALPIKRSYVRRNTELNRLKTFNYKGDQLSLVSSTSSLSSISEDTPGTRRSTRERKQTYLGKGAGMVAVRTASELSSYVHNETANGTIKQKSQSKSTKPTAKTGKTSVPQRKKKKTETDEDEDSEENSETDETDNKQNRNKKTGKTSKKSAPRSKKKKTETDDDDNEDISETDEADNKKNRNIKTSAKTSKRSAPQRTNNSKNSEDEDNEKTTTNQIDNEVHENMSEHVSDAMPRTDKSNITSHPSGNFNNDTSMNFTPQNQFSSPSYLNLHRNNGSLGRKSYENNLLRPQSGRIEKNKTNKKIKSSNSKVTRNNLQQYLSANLSKEGELLVVKTNHKDGSIMGYLTVKPQMETSYKSNNCAMCYIVLSGKGEFREDDHVQEFEKEEFLSAPIGSKYRIKNTSSNEDLRLGFVRHLPSS